MRMINLFLSNADKKIITGRDKPLIPSEYGIILLNLFLKKSSDDSLPGAAVATTSFACITQDQPLVRLPHRLHHPVLKRSTQFLDLLFLSGAAAPATFFACPPKIKTCPIASVIPSSRSPCRSLIS
ncbi:hypothetical protein TNCV_924281 [Trichonephila clavipes]|nr:hypothetical protein TNCV_924281 [Trichonephila clavipes]